MAEAIFVVPGEAEAADVVPAVDGVYVYNSAHVDEAIGHLIQWFKRPRNMEVLRITIGQIQQLEDAYNQLLGAWDVNTAVGDQLDKLGLRVGELRDDRVDAVYRIAIKVRVLVNSSEGTLNELLAILAMADEDLVSVARESYPAGVYFRWLSPFAGLSAQDLMNLLKQAKPAGVKVQAVIRNPTTGFRWGAVADAGDATDLAFGDIAGTTGGLLEQVVN